MLYFLLFVQVFVHSNVTANREFIFIIAAWTVCRADCSHYTSHVHYWN